MSEIPRQPSQPWPDKYEMLDGFRGIAASGVVLHHLNVADIGHYCVMMFFVISGYCITASAISGTRKGMSTRQFIYNRIRRIYPPYLLAVAFFAATRMVRFYVTGETWAPTLTMWLQNFTLTQWCTLVFHPVVEAPQNPALFVAAFWSLAYEIQFYLVMALGLLLVRYRRLPLVQFVGALTLLGMSLNFGWPILALRGIFIEYWGHFGLGSCLYFLLCAGERRWSPTAQAVLVGLLMLVSWLSLDRQGELASGFLRVYLEYGVSVGTVLMLVLLRPYDSVLVRFGLWRPISAVGTISYSLYLVHQFNLTVVAKTANLMLPPTSASSANLALQFFLHLLLATIFWACCERPFQKRSGASSPHQAGTRVNTLG